MYNPREVTQGSIMPRYTWLFENKTEYNTLPKKMAVMKTLGVPYSQADIDGSIVAAESQATVIINNLVETGGPKEAFDKEIIPLIAYLQRIGVDYGKSEVQP
jgi:cytochrome c oxidase cbb3-type subunit I/II